ncbi:hypothetical protein ACT4ML_13560 [Natrinema sp. LN54]|uniref:hypothetical protein n=1 Tax=Natrinema sp. LN54 TaxID=3458705 RepID=UPI00403500CF
MREGAISLRSRTQNTALTVVLLIGGYVLPFIAEHLNGPRGVGETLLFLLGHTYFHFYLLCVAVTVVVMGTAWYHLEARPLACNYALSGIGYGLVTGIVFSAFYVVFGTQIYSFVMNEIYVAILLGIGFVVGSVTGVLRRYTIGYRS